MKSSKSRLIISAALALFILITGNIGLIYSPFFGFQILSLIAALFGSLFFQMIIKRLKQQ